LQTSKWREVGPSAWGERKSHGNQKGVGRRKKDWGGGVRNKCSLNPLNGGRESPKWPKTVGGVTRWS